MKGKKEAFSTFRDILAEEMSQVLPELHDDIVKVVEETGGRSTAVAKPDSS